MKVLHLIDSGGLYGAEKMLLTLVEAQLQQGIEPLIFSVGAPGIGEKPLETEAKRLGLPIKTWRMKPGLNLAGMRQILAFANDAGYTHLHSHGYKFNILLAAQQKKRLRQMTLATIHGYVKAKPFTKMWVYEIADRLVLRRLDRIVLVNDVMRLEHPFAGLPDHRIASIPNGVKVASPGQSGSEIRLDIRAFLEKHPATLLMVGRLAPEKAIDIALSALKTLAGDHPQLGICVMGTGRLEGSLRKQVSEAKLTDRVLFAGYISNPMAYFQHSFALLMPSRTEGLPMALLEAMHHGLPVIASAVGGIPLALDQGKAGLLIPPANEAALVAAIRELMTNPRLESKLAEAARERARKVYSDVAMANAYREIYRHANPGATA